MTLRRAIMNLRAIIMIMIAVISFDLSTAHKSDRQCDEQE
jgi:hypothetical protein